MHSKKKTADEIFEFLREWDNASPVVIVPTTYFRTPSTEFGKAGVSIVIWANHLVRASVAAMQQTAQTIFSEQSVESINDFIVPVKELFRLQGEAELEEAEKRYLPQPGEVRA